MICLPVWSQQATVAPAVEASAESLAAWEYDLSPADEALLEKVQRGCFQYFWREVGTPAMLAKDKTSDTVCSIAAVGFQLASLPIAVERGWISRAEGQQRDTDRAAIACGSAGQQEIRHLLPLSR